MAWKLLYRDFEMQGCLRALCITGSSSKAIIEPSVNHEEVIPHGCQEEGCEEEGHEEEGREEEEVTGILDLARPEGRVGEYADRPSSFFSAFGLVERGACILRGHVHARPF